MKELDTLVEEVKAAWAAKQLEKQHTDQFCIGSL